MESSGRDASILDRLLPFALAVAFAPALFTLAGHWASEDYYHHGFLVPVIAWISAHPRLRGLGAPGRQPLGLVALVVSLALYLAGLAAGEAFLQGLALVGALTSLVAFRWGLRGLRRLAFPLAFLLFMLPLPVGWVNPIIVGLQTIASASAVAVLHTFDVAVLREGNVLRLPGGGSLFVAEACSGITSLLSLIPIGVLLARFTESVTWRRVLLVVAVVPAALLGNGIRVVATVIAAGHVGPERATTGPVHDMAGLATSAFAILLVIGFGALLRRFYDAPAVRAETASA